MRTFAKVYTNSSRARRQLRLSFSKANTPQTSDKDKRHVDTYPLRKLRLEGGRNPLCRFSAKVGTTNQHKARVMALRFVHIHIHGTYHLKSILLQNYYLHLRLQPRQPLLFGLIFFEELAHTQLIAAHITRPSRIPPKSHPLPHRWRRSRWLSRK